MHAGQQNSGVHVYLSMGVYSSLYGTHEIEVNNKNEHF